MNNQIGDILINAILQEIEMCSGYVISDNQVNHYKYMMNNTLKAMFEAGKKAGREEILNET